MPVFNLGSINADHFYDLPHLPAAGETLAALSLSRGLGGKGANMSVAATRAGCVVHHIGAVGPDGAWAIDRLADYGVDVANIARLSTPTGHAIIALARDGENSIILFPGANHEITETAIRAALASASSGDTLLLQNETNNQAFCAGLGSEMGLRVAYAAAPFSAQAIQAVLPYLDFLILNEVEAQQLETATGLSPAELGVPDVVVTLGAAGSRWYDNRTSTLHAFAAPRVTPVDTTGAGDTFTGYVLAALDQGRAMPEAITLATRAAALMVTRHGTADVIPHLAEVLAS